LFDVAAKERWKNVVLHDCSNETKFFRGTLTAQRFGMVDYGPVMNLPKSFYRDALLRYNLGVLKK